MSASDAGPSEPEVRGGDSSSPDGSSSTTTAAATLGETLKTLREARGWTRTKLDSTAELGSGTTKAIEEAGRVPGTIVLRRIAKALDADFSHFEEPDVSQRPRETSGSAERRPTSSGAKARSKLFGRKAKSSGPDAPAAPQARPSAGRRVSTSPLTESLLTFAAGGMDRIGQRPLGAFTAFTAPVAGEIVDEVVAGTVADRLVQPLVRGSEKYNNLAALFAGYASIAWATNVPEAEPQAFALFQWSMTTLLPLQGKQMVKRAKDQAKAMEALEEIMPELAKLVPPQFASDPIRGLWAMMWAQPAPEPAPAEEPAAV